MNDKDVRPWTRQEVLATLGLRMKYKGQSDDEADAVFTLLCPQRDYVSLSQKNAGPLTKGAFVARHMRKSADVPPVALAEFCAREHQNAFGGWYFSEGPGAQAEAKRDKASKGA